MGEELRIVGKIGSDGGRDTGSGASFNTEGSFPTNFRSSDACATPRAQRWKRVTVRMGRLRAVLLQAPNYGRIR